MEKPRSYSISDLFYIQWRELSAAQRVQLHELNTSRQQQPVEQQGTYIILMMRVLRKRPLLVDRLNEVQVVDIFNELFLTSLSSPWLFFAAPPTRLALRGYAAPDEKMGNLTFDHFIYADSEFTQCTGAEHMTHMNALAAIIYTPGKLITNKKHTLDANMIFIKQAFYTFGNVRDYIVKACVNLFPPNEGNKKETKESALQLWTEMKYALAEQGVFGTYKEVGEQPLYEVITYLEKRAREPKPKANANPA